MPGCGTTRSATGCSATSSGSFGAHAQFLTVPADGFLARVPDDVPDDVAAAATEGAHYAVAVLRSGLTV